MASGIRNIARQDRVEGQQHEADAEPTDIGLPLPTDVEQPGMERDRDRKPGEHEIGRVIERVADGFRISERAVDENAHRFERVGPDREHDQPGEEKCDQHVRDRNQSDLDPTRQRLAGRAHAAGAPVACRAIGRRPDIRHHQAERALVGFRAADLADDATAEHHHDAVRERHHLVEFDRDQQDRAAGITDRDELAMDELDRADIDAARRLSDQQHARRGRDLARQHELLLVAAGEVGAAQRRTARADVELLHQPGAMVGDRAMMLQQRATERRIVVIAEHRGLVRGECADQTAAQPILRHMRDAEPAHRRRIGGPQRRDLAPADREAACGGRPYSGEHIEQFALPVARNARRRRRSRPRAA